MEQIKGLIGKCYGTVEQSGNRSLDLASLCSVSLLAYLTLALEYLKNGNCSLKKTLGFVSVREPLGTTHPFALLINVKKWVTVYLWRKLRTQESLSCVRSAGHLAQDPVWL